MARSSEFELIDWIASQEQWVPESLLVGIGDDCAILDPSIGRRLAVTVDALVEEVHFRRRWTSPRFLGRKALAVNLSDLAAVGAQPYACLLDLSLPRELVPAYARELILGLLEECRRWSCPLIGGNLSGGREIKASVTALGFLDQGEALLRHPARSGDFIGLVGEAGLAREGLSILQAEDPDLSEISDSDALLKVSGSQRRFRCLHAYLVPNPMVEAGCWLRRQGLAQAMIDVSDGLSLDLTLILRRNGVAACLDSSSLSAAGADGGISLETLLQGGEDYALLFFASPAQAKRLAESYPGELTSYRIIGRLEDGEAAIFLRDDDGNRRRFEAKGYEHFQ